MRPADPPTWRRLWWLPRSRAGRWSVALFLLAVASVLFIAAAAAQGPAGTLGGDPLLAAPAVLAAAFGVTSAGLGGYAIVHHERALVLLLTTAAGLNVLAYVLGEAIRTT